MKHPANDFVLHVATINGSGSQSANNILVKSLFRMGLPVGGKNLFPSNIAGLPTWFTIRVHPRGYTCRRAPMDIVVSLNEATLAEDVRSLGANGFFFYNSDFKIQPHSIRPDIRGVALPLRDLCQDLSTNPRLRKLLANVIYVGVMARLLGVDPAVVRQVIVDQFGDKTGVIESNTRAFERGFQFADENLGELDFPYRVEAMAGGNDGQILIDGNSAAALGNLVGGCTFVAWYPITPSSSVIETFESMANRSRVDAGGRKSFAVVQAEDELSAICMTVGAGWAGARAMTATSGPGLSLMAEAAGLSYYAEIPAVIWNVQRVGPSTGLPTRTMQGDLTAAVYLSHGDTQHVVLLPANPAECFEFGQMALDLAEQLQTLVIVLSDLDLGMNLHRSTRFVYPEKPLNRGKVLNAAELDRAQKFQRYKDLDGDGIAARTLPGTEHPLAAYFTRGTGHDENSNYSENPDVFRANLSRLSHKWQTARTLVPRAVLEESHKTPVALLAYGSSDMAITEIQAHLEQRGLKTNYARPRAWPTTAALEPFLTRHQRIYVIEQNRDGQMCALLRAQYPALAERLHSVVQFNGLPLEPRSMAQHILKLEDLREPAEIITEVSP